VSEHEVEIDIQSPAVVVYDLLADISRMSQWSPEVVRCRWVRGASRAQPGARFRGWSRKGWRIWSTLSIVTVADRPATFEWRVTFVRLPVATWRYTMLDNRDGGTTLREVAVDERGPALRRLSPFITGSRDRRERNDETMQVTLARVKAAAEATTASR
jgi:hypothetical protein